ncbi:MAG: MarC family protein, partial [Anaerolineae bacterium]
LGDFLLRLLNIKHYTVMIAGGMILFLIALKMIFPTRKDPDIEFAEEKEPLIVPLAIPLVAGPAVLATVMLYSRQHVSYFLMISAIIIAWGASTVILLASSWLKNLLGSRGLTACERLMGLIIVLLAVEMFLQGVHLYTTPSIPPSF